MFNGTEAWKTRMSVHTENILFFRKILNNVNTLRLRIIVDKGGVDNIRAYNIPEQPHNVFNDVISTAMSVESICIEERQWCTIAQNYAATDRDSFATKYVDYYYARGIIATAPFSPDEETKIITNVNFPCVWKMSGPIKISRNFYRTATTKK